MKRKAVSLAIAAALQGTQNEEHKMGQHNLSPLDRARLAIDEAVVERDKFLALLIVLTQKLDNDVVITHAELENMGMNVQLKQSDPTEIGFRLTTAPLPTM